MTGAKKASIIAAVAVLDINIDRVPMTVRKPSNTNLGFVPNGRSMARAKNTSSPTLLAVIARTNPPRKSMITGSAKLAITPLCESREPTTSGSTMGLRPLSEQKSSINTMMAIDVAHDETISRIHINVANAKIAMTRC